MRNRLRSLGLLVGPLMVMLMLANMIGGVAPVEAAKKASKTTATYKAAATCPTDASAIASMSVKITRSGTVYNRSNLSSVAPGDTVSVSFDLNDACSNYRVSLVAYKAPDTTNNLDTLSSRVVSSSATNLFGSSGGTLTVTIPACYYAVVFATGTVLSTMSASSTYGAREVDTDNGGTYACSGITAGQPTYFSGSPTCATLGATYGETWAGTTDSGAIANGTTTIATGYSVTISGATGGTSFNWSSTGTALRGVFVQASGGGNLYRYTSGAYSSTGLKSVGTADGGMLTTTSVLYCYVPIPTQSVCPSGADMISAYRFEIWRSGSKISDATDLNNVAQGDTVKAYFTLADGCTNKTISLAAYEAPQSYYDINTVDQQIYKKVTGDTGSFSATQSATARMVQTTAPNCNFQVDFVIGGVIVDLDSNNLYGDNKISWKNGGSQLCSWAITPSPTATNTATNTPNATSTFKAGQTATSIAQTSTISAQLTGTSDAKTATSVAKTATAAANLTATYSAQQTGTSVAATTIAVANLTGTSVAKTQTAVANLTGTSVAATTTSVSQTSVAATTTSVAQTSVAATTTSVAQTSVAATTTSVAQTSVAATQTSVSKMQTSVAATTTSIAQTSVANTATSVAQTSVAATQTSVAATTTFVANQTATSVAKTQTASANLTATYSAQQTATSVSQTSVAATQTSVAATTTIVANQTATSVAKTQTASANLTATYSAQQTATSVAATTTAVANQTSTPNAATATYSAQQTATSVAKTQTASANLTATYSAQQTATSVSQTSVAATQTSVAATTTIVANQTATSVAKTQTASANLTATYSAQQTATSVSQTSVAATQTSVAATTTIVANQTATSVAKTQTASANLTATYSAQQTGTSVAATTTAAANLTMTFAAQQTATSVAQTTTAVANLTSTAAAQQTATSVAKTATASVPTATPVPGHLRIHKHDTADNSPLDGACFSVRKGSWHMNVCDGDSNDMSTDDGVVQLNGLVPATYMVQEMTAPEHYDIDPNAYPVAVPANDTVAITISDSQIPGSILIHKQDDNGHALVGACFAITGSGYNSTVCDNATGDSNPSNGEVLVKNLVPGDYRVKESSAPAGYDKDPEAYDTYVMSGDMAATELTIVNSASTGSLLIHKVDDDTKPLAGACFTVSGPGFSGTLCDGGANDANAAGGELQLANLVPGVYTVVEQTAPNGYALNVNVYTVTVQAGTAATAITIQNSLFGELDIFKVDQDGLKKFGACFEVSGPNDFYAFICDDDTIETGDWADSSPVSGEIFLQHLTPGTYTVTEASPPDGYIMDTTSHNVVVPAGGIGEVTIVNYLDSTGGPGTNVTIWKLNCETMPTNVDPIAVATGTIPANCELAPAGVTFDISGPGMTTVVGVQTGPDGSVSVHVGLSTPSMTVTEYPNTNPGYVTSGPVTYGGIQCGCGSSDVVLINLRLH